MTLDALNALPHEDARRELLRCCGSLTWAERVTLARPFTDRMAFTACAERVWWSLEPDDWREAFAHHPRIGDLDSLRKRFASTADWARNEQAGAAAASEETLVALADGNRAYEERFGFRFIVCATGKSAGQMLALLRDRLGHGPEVELRAAAGEQMKITSLRLEKLLKEGA